MQSVTFTKYEGLGNDFVIIDESEQKERRVPSISLKERIRICDRTFGVGADGVLTLLPPKSDKSLVFMHVTNSDGSTPENCGNGLRCVGRWLFDNARVAQGESFFIDTASGPKKAVVDGDEVKVNLGVARVDTQFVDDALTKEIAHRAESADIDEPQILSFVDLGNPHLVLEANAVAESQKVLGPVLEKMPVFEHGANISFFRFLRENTIELRVFERGAGATKACGTGAGATVASLYNLGRVNKLSYVTVVFECGTLDVFINPLVGSEYEVTIRGEAKRQFSGEWKFAE